MKNFEFNKGLNLKTRYQEGEVVSGEEISNEYYGDAADVTRLDYTFGGHKRTFVLKDYEQSPSLQTNERDSRIEVQRSITMWQATKGAGLPTFTTYRSEKDGTSILMNDLRTEKTSALSVTHSPQEWYDGDLEDNSKIKDIVNFDELMQEFKRCAIQAADGNFSLEPDAYFFLVTERSDGNYEIHPFIGDFEGMSFFEDNENFNANKQDRVDYNLKHAKLALWQFVNLFIEPKNVDGYVNAINREFGIEM